MDLKLIALFLGLYKYSTNDFKEWYDAMINYLCGPDRLFKCWIESNEDNAKKYVKRFTEIYNYLSDIFELDQIQSIE